MIYDIYVSSWQHLGSSLPDFLQRHVSAIVLEAQLHTLIRWKACSTMHNAPVFCSLQATMATRLGTGFQRDRAVPRIGPWAWLHSSGALCSRSMWSGTWRWCANRTTPLTSTCASSAQITDPDSLESQILLTALFWKCWLPLVWLHVLLILYLGFPA